MGRNGKSIPLYKHIYGNLRDGILSGKYKEGEILPSENFLCRQYNTSRQTARNSLKMLTAQGLARNLPGRGWEVSRPDGRIIAHKKGVLVFLGPSSPESSCIFESIRKSYREHFSELNFHMKPFYENPDWYAEFTETEIKCGKADAVIVFDDTPLPDNFVSSMKSAEIPFVCLPLNGQYQYDNIGTDNASASCMMLDYLFERGHENIIFVTSAELDKLPSFNLRRTGYSVAMEKKGLAPEIIIADVNFWQAPKEEKLIIEKVKSMKSQGKPPTCIFCATTTPVIEILAILKRNSIRVPDEISICSFGCPQELRAISAFGIDSFTYLEEQFDVMGAIAVERLIMKSRISTPVSTLVPARINELRVRSPKYKRDVLNSVPTAQ
jgi:DNA-binding LacI/PurR family transcriptional regulator